MAPIANQPSPSDMENLFRNVKDDDSKKNHCLEPGDYDGLASPERRQWRSYETKLREGLKEMLASNSFVGLIAETYSKATRFIYTQMEAEMIRGGRVHDVDGDKIDKKRQLPNQLGSNLEFWLLYACI